MSTTPLASESPDRQEWSFPVEGMSGAACAGRVERALRAVPGVAEARVDLDSETARVRAERPLAFDGLEHAIRRAGYVARAPGPPASPRDATVAAAAPVAVAVAVAVASTIVLLLPMLGAIAGLAWRWPAWLQFALATPVQFWLGARLYAGAWRALRGGAADRDVLAALATTAAYGLGLAAWWAPAHAGPAGAGGDPYFAVGAAVVTLVLVGQRLEAGDRHAPIQRLVDRVSAVFVPGACVVALMTLAGRGLATHDWAHALRDAAAVLVMACPGALALATPLAIRAGTDVAARRGIRFEDVGALERAHGVTVVAFDKTGTLTEGKPMLVACEAVDGDAARLLGLAAAVQGSASHPLARAVTSMARQTRVRPFPATAGRAVAGRGMAARVQVPPPAGLVSEARRRAETLAADAIRAARAAAGLQAGSEAPPARARELRLGSARWMAELDVDTRALAGRAAELQASGRTVCWLADVTEEPVLLGLLGFGDRLRDGAIDAVQRLRAAGLRTVLVSGDGHASAEATARLLGIEEVHAELLPGDKAALVAALRDGGRDGRPSRVAMVGDGLEDAPALAAADVGIAMAGGVDLARPVAGITLVGRDPRLVADALDLSRRCVARIRQNLFLAFACNAAGIGLATAGLLTPMAAAAAIALGSAGVALNAFALRRWRPDAA